MIFQHRRFIAIGIPALVLAFSSLNAHAADEAPSFEVYGFGQGDYIQDFKRVNPAWEDTLRPSRIPTQEFEFGSDGQASISVKQSRFGAKGLLPVKGKALTSKVEFDFFGVGVDEGQTTIRLRHAYGEWGPWLAGQTHSLFMDVDVFPNVIDYWGPAGMVFLRLPQIRWTPINGDTTISLAIERPSNDIDPGQIRQFDPELGANITNDEKAPDITAQIRTGKDWGHVQLSGIVRRLGFDTPGGPEAQPKNNTLGWGASLTSKLNVGRDKLYLSGTYGRGIASYMNDGGTDLAPQGAPGTLSPKAVPLLGLMLYYDHLWSDTWSSTFGYARTQVQNTTFQAGDAFHIGEYASINLLNSPDENLLYGAEVLWGARTDKDEGYGYDLRAQISMKFSFSSLDWTQVR